MAETLAVDRRHAQARTFLLKSPLLVLVAVIVLLAVLLALPLTLPIGPMYWDLAIYFDAANRIFEGQTPVVDFFAPVGPLGYYLFAGAIALFSKAQPLLVAHWSILAVTAPLMALVLTDVDRRSRGTAFALLAPFLIFAVLPFNTREYYPFPGSDGFGIYNRQVCQLLYVLVAGLVFCRGQRRLAVVVTAAMAALFFTKITGFTAGAVLCAYAFLAGRIGWRWAAASAGTFLAVLGLVELHDGLVSHYIGDILALVAMNSGSLAPRFLQAASQTFGIVAPAGVLLTALLWWERDRLSGHLGALWRERRPAAVAAIANRDAFMLGAVLFAGILFETQNTGSQALIFAWPALLSILVNLGTWPWRPVRLGIVVALAGAAVLPPAVNTIERAARTYIGALQYPGLEQDNLGTLGRVSVRPEMMARADRMIDFYARNRETYADFVRVGELPSFIFHSEPDFQIVYLMAADRAVSSLRALEADHGIRFDTIMSLNFVNPFPWLMERAAPRHIAIGADPGRAVPALDAPEEEAVRESDIVLYPTCPPTTANRALLDIYEPALAGHRKITLDACYEAYVHPRFADKLD